MPEFDREAFRDAAQVEEVAPPPPKLAEIPDGVAEAVTAVGAAVGSEAARATAAEQQVADIRAAAEREQLADAAIAHVEDMEYDDESAPWLIANQVGRGSA